MNWPELESLMTDGIAPQGKNMTHIVVSPRIKDAYEHTLAVENSVGFVQWMIEKEKVDQEIGMNLINMLKSPDKDNFNIAILAIEQMKK